VSFAVPPGHCLAIVGTIGSGREELVRALFGAEPFDAGTITYQGSRLQSWSAARATRAGIGYVPAERKTEGMVGGFNGPENMAIARTGTRKLFVNPWRERKDGAQWFETMDVRPRDVKLHLSRFSGGNQQKVVMAKWLKSETLKLLILDHPLRGLDPGAAETVNEKIREARDSGTAIVLLADTLEEALDMGDTVLVMRDGEITAHFDLTVDTPTTLDLLEKMV
jgi:ribose transport system ATP-binding protein